MFTTYATGGLIAGLAFGIIDFVVLLPLILRPFREAIAASRDPAEREKIVGRVRLIRIVFLVQLVAFPVVGYLVGRAFDGASP